MSWSPGQGFVHTAPPRATGFDAADRTWNVDVVIVGAGPGGAAVARVLCAAGHKVLMLEEGPPTSNFRKNYGHVMRYHMQEGGGVVGMGRAPISIAAGRGIGGGSLINSAIAWRTPDTVLQEWSALLQDDRFGPQRLAPVYDELWELLGIWETPVEIAGRNNQIVVDGVRALGLEGGFLSRYTPRCVGCGMCYFGCPSDGKGSVNFNLLALAAQDGLQIHADTKIDALIVEGGRVVGVSGRMFHPDSRAPGGRVEVRAERVVLCAGAIGTPRLLHAAGVADALGPAVGVGLHLHPGSTVMARCDEPVHMWQGATQAAWFNVPDGPGILPHTFSATPEVLVSMLGGVGPDAPAALPLIPFLCGSLVMVSDKSQGTVSAWPDGRANVSYTFDDHDVERIKLGLYWAAKVVQAGGAHELYAPIFGVGRCEDADQLAERIHDKTIRDFTLYAAHPMSTCRMGLDPQTAVLRPDGRTHGLEGLYIADGSMFPTSLGVNPSVTIMAMATVIARGMV